MQRLYEEKGGASMGRKIPKEHISKRHNKVNRSPVTTGLLFAFITLLGLFMVIPLVLIIGNSFKPLNELWIFPPKLLPMEPTLRNFQDMLTVMSDSVVPFSRYFFNTILVTVCGTAGHIILASMCAFPMAKKKFPGRNVLFNLIVLALMFNGTVTAIPNYITMASLRWINTYLALIVPAFAAPLGLYLMKQFMEQIPDALLEAARIDGASQWHIFWRIVMPNVKSAWLTLMLLSVQGLWNMGSTTYVFSEELKTLAYALSQILAGGIARQGVGNAVSVLMMTVPICIFLFTQSNIIETMSTSGMKD
jgi:ABC-type glycerol-3-phosphate transport system permease component